MKNKKFLYFYIITLVSICYSCSQSHKNENFNRVHFSISSEDRKIVLPILLNDSVLANLFFDTGGTFLLDSTFCTNNPNIISDISFDRKILTGSAWTDSRIPAQVYNNPFKLLIGNVEISYDRLLISNYKTYLYNNKIDGMLNIPENDTTNVWELNFEHNYLEIHPADGFNMPENCFTIEMVKDENRPYPIQVELPFMVSFANGDTLLLDRVYTIDTGMPYDIALTHRTEEMNLFNKKDDAVWTGLDSYHTYYKYHIVNATLFDDFVLDSLRIYTFDRPNFIKSDYLIGQNFLKRFNVFFDMKNRQIGLQPVEKFQRLINPDHRRFHFSTYRMQDGKIIVREVADYGDNYYKTAGLQEGDEILSVNNKPFKEVTPQEIHHFNKQDTLVYNIIRQGKPLKIIVLIDKNEVQGD